METQPKHVIAGIHVTNRARNVSNLQPILTEYGCSIRTRIGLHETSEQHCSPNGLIVLEMFGDEKEYAGMFDKLRAIEGVEVRVMEFTH